jgi:mRNA interferase MazF
MMPLMTTYEFGDVVLVPFPFTDQTTTKKRPTIVVSSQDYNSARPDLIEIAVSSQIRWPLLFGEAEITDWQAAGLLKISVIKPVLTTLQKNLVIRQLGKLQNSDCQTLELLLQLVLKK